MVYINPSYSGLSKPLLHSLRSRQQIGCRNGKRRRGFNRCTIGLLARTIGDCQHRSDRAGAAAAVLGVSLSLVAKVFLLFLCLYYIYASFIARSLMLMTQLGFE